MVDCYSEHGSANIFKVFCVQVMEKGSIRWIGGLVRHRRQRWHLFLKREPSKKANPSSRQLFYALALTKGLQICVCASSNEPDEEVQTSE